MNSLVIDTNDFLYDEESVYCYSCKSCGEFGCECWFHCQTLKCKYGDGLIVAYEKMKKDMNTYYEMLRILGIEDPDAVDIEKVKIIACSDAEVYYGETIYKSMKYYYTKLKI